MTRFGLLPGGTPVEKIALCRGGMSCAILTYGGTLQALNVPDREGKPVDVVLGFDDLKGYREQTNYIGALVGRYANRIARGRFVLNGEEYVLCCNNGENHLHGGAVGFDKRVWTVDSVEKDRVTLSLFSPDGEEGYPGNLSVRVTYTLTEDALELDYEGVSDRDTLCNLTNHAYFNLAGHGGAPVTGQSIRILGDRYTPTDAGLIPLGELAPVEGTPMDLREAVLIGSGMNADFHQIVQAGGYDHNWAVNGDVGRLRLGARAFCPETGIAMEVETTLPGIQLYVSNFEGEGLVGKNGVRYVGRSAFCLETQFYPDSPNRPAFPQAILRAGEKWTHKTVFRFSVQ